MKLLNYLAASAVAAISVALPALARVDPNSTALLRTLNEYGVEIRYNPPGCDTGYQGMYQTSKVITLCYSGQPTAGDHDTLRHETFHYLQHCAALHRGEPGIVPLAINPSERNQWVSQVLKRGHIEEIQRLYPSQKHQIELEAFAAAYHYSANDLIGMIHAWCKK
jgi:hypothetical protein